MLEPGGPGVTAGGGTAVRRPLRLRRALSLIAAATTAACGGAAGAQDDPGGSSGQAASGPAATAQDGSLAFTVSDVDCSRAALGTSQADGVFCVVPVTVTNDGDAPQAIDVTIQRAYDAEGNEYSGVGGLGAALPEARFPAELGPGEEVSGDLVFDVPEGTELAELQLNDNPYSSGVTVDLP